MCEFVNAKNNVSVLFICRVNRDRDIDTARYASTWKGRQRERIE